LHLAILATFFNGLVKQAMNGFIQLASSRHMSATLSAHQGLAPLFALRQEAANRKR